MSRVVCVKVANIRPKYENLEEWTLDPQNVYIGRKGIIFIDNQRFPKQDSIWANPFRISKEQSREKVISKYREYITKKLASGEIPREELEKLRGKALGCWCYPDPCHGDVLVELVNAQK